MADPLDLPALRELARKAAAQEWPDGEGTIIQLGLAARAAVPALLDRLEWAEAERDELAATWASIAEGERKDVTRALAERDAALAEVERLRPFEPRIKSLSLEGEEARATFATTREFREHFATTLAATVLGENAPNYVEIKVVHPAEGEFAVTVQRCAGKTPHEFRLAAEAEAAAARRNALEEAARVAEKRWALQPAVCAYDDGWRRAAEVICREIRALAAPPLATDATKEPTP